MINFLKKHWLFIFLGALATFLVTLWLYGQSLQKLPILPKITISELEGPAISLNTSLSFNITSPLPTQAVIYTYKNTALTSEQINNIAKILNFTVSPSMVQDSQSTVYYWNDQDKFLSVNINNGEISFGHYQAPQDNTLPFPTTDEVENLFNELAKNLGLSSNLEFKVQQTRFLKTNGYNLAETDISRANLLELTATPQINNISITTFFGQPLAIMRISRDKTLYSLKTTILPNLTAGPSYPLKNIREIQAMILTEGKIFNSGQSTENDQITLNSLGITKSKLVYYLSPKNTILSPVFILGGENNTAQIGIPAISSNYFLLR
ncbi:hypothetical protein HY404_02460 [Candidatus Microgenomates bacterium]|nr:hypothetical protein [Candidatus Microgenomates bacterium]